MKKPRLILHIGSHKTGTTGIQRFCGANRDILRQQGVLYPSYELVQDKEHYAHHGLAHGLAGQDPNWPVEKVRHFLKLVAGQCPEDGQVLLSAEPLFRHVIGNENRKSGHLPDREYWRAKKRYIEVVADALQDFDVEIVAVFRKQTEFFNSLYQEMIKVTRFSGTPFEFYLMKRHEFNYFGQMKTWSECFPNIRVLIFEELLKNGTLVHDFLSTISRSPLELPEVSSQMNTSLHPLIIETKRQFNALPLVQGESMRPADSHKGLKQLQKYALSKKWISDVRRYSYLTPAEVRFLSVSCRTSNLKLRRSYFPDGSQELESYSADPPLVDFGDARSIETVKRLLPKLLKITKTLNS